MALKWRDTDSAAAELGWQRADSPTPPWYRFNLPEIRSTPAASIALSLAFSNNPPGEIDDYDPPGRINLTLRLEDIHGTRAELQLTQRRALLPQVEPQLFQNWQPSKKPHQNLCFNATGSRWPNGRPWRHHSIRRPSHP